MDTCIDLGRALNGLLTCELAQLNGKYGLSERLSVKTVANNLEPMIKELDNIVLENATGLRQFGERKLGNLGKVEKLMTFWFLKSFPN